MFKILFFSSLIFISLPAFAQNKTYIGVEGALTHDIFTIDPNINDFASAFFGNSDYISQNRLYEESFGVTLSREMNKNFILEAGLISKNFVMGYRYSKK